MAYNILSVLTFKSVSAILATGGTQSWVLNRVRAKACIYAVLCRNAHDPRVEGPEPHHMAFMVGRISDVVPSVDKGRWLVEFSEYALCQVPEQWSGRNPVAYWTTDDFAHIDFDQLKFQPMPGPSAPVQAPAVATRDPAGLTLGEAKAGLAATYNVPPASVEIIIRG